jgi:corrinoid protein of di/trimethylamine methyltransferase
LPSQRGLDLGEKSLLERLRDNVVKFNLEGVRITCLEALETGISPEKAILEGLASGMDIVGQLFNEDQYFLSELIMAAEAMTEGTSILSRHTKKNLANKGTVTIGTVRGDIHDIGKNIVKSLLEAAGFTVQDLGVDVQPEVFLEHVKKGARIVALSALMTTTKGETRTVIEKLSKEGIRGETQIMVGGAPIIQSFANKIGADGYGEDAIQAVELAKEWSSRGQVHQDRN